VSPARRRLGKRHVEELLERYDADPVGALTIAMRVVMGVNDDSSGDAGSDSELDGLVQRAGFDPVRARAIAQRRPEALDALAAELNELRTLP
jgi:hypothetical protein